MVVSTVDVGIGMSVVENDGGDGTGDCMVVEDNVGKTVDVLSSIGFGGLGVVIVFEGF